MMIKTAVTTVQRNKVTKNAKERRKAKNTKSLGKRPVKKKKTIAAAAAAMILITTMMITAVAVAVTAAAMILTKTTSLKERN